ncbi:hypothetical protein LXA43DRAFT_1122948 [Ganoderma leucocontextum]|nr:hypothetical protein LXA43DRAFT_1122948 [Ganoderma leucocontextum]
MPRPAGPAEEPRPCPRIWRPSSLLSRRIYFYIHEWLLKHLFRWYCRFRDISGRPGTYPLPFGLILKNGPRVREQEGLAMILACAMGIPAPRLPGTALDALSHEQVDFDIIRDDLVRILTLMRSFSSPWRDTICGVYGGPIAGPLLPLSPLQACPNEAAFYQLIREIGNFAANGQDEKRSSRSLRSCRRLHARRSQSAQHHGRSRWARLWHRRLQESAAWLAGYWEVTITAILPQREWGRFMHERVTSGGYAEEVRGASLYVLLHCGFFEILIVAYLPNGRREEGLELYQLGRASSRVDECVRRVIIPFAINTATIV